MPKVQNLPGPTQPSPSPSPSGPLAPAPRPKFEWRSLSKVDQSRLILTATTALVSLVLLIWLLIAPTIQPRGGVFAALIDPGEPAPSGLRLATRDAGAIGRAPTGGRPDGLAPGVLLPELRRLLDRLGDRPVVLYLATPGVGDGARMRLLVGDGDEYAVATPNRDPDAGTTMEAVLELLSKSPSRQKLLILDAGLIGTDRRLGVFGNGFLHQLQNRLREQKFRGLAVLCSCAPGQVSWTSEGDGQSVFGYFVSRGLAGAAASWNRSSRVTVQGLHRYVAAQVSHWVRANRQATQTPVLLGEHSLNFGLPRIAPGLGDPLPSWDSKPLAEFHSQLHKEWTARDQLAKLKPYRHAPRLWRRYEETLLQAEWALRSGQESQLRSLLIDLEAQKKALATRASGPVPSRAWSLAMLRATATDPARRKQADDGERALHEALDRLTGKPKPPATPAPAPGKADNSTPAKSAPKAEAKPDAKSAKTTPETKSPPGPAPGPEGAPGAEEPAQEPGGLALLDQVAAIPGLLDPQNAERSLYLEGQVLVWALRFARQAEAPETFQGYRGRLLNQIVESRFRAERAAGDERVPSWMLATVEEGDEARREVQDRLFVGGRPAPEIPRRLDDADQIYERALNEVRLYAHALDLVQEIAAEGPYYADWQARIGSATDSTAADLMDEAAGLADLLFAAGPEAPTGQARTEALPALNKAYAKTREHYAWWTGEFQSACARLSATNRQAPWRQVDAVLCVPTIPAELRAKLLERVHTPAPSLTEESTGSPSSSEPLPPTDPDPEFWPRALQEARLECGLLKLGGIGAAELNPVLDALRAAERAIQGGDPDRAFAYFTSLSGQVRAVRRSWADRLRRPPDSEAGQPIARRERDLTSLDRVVRVLPPPVAVATPDDTPTDRLGRTQHQARLLWHGLRLLRDFASEHARLVLRDAEQGSPDAPDLRAALSQAQARAELRIDVQRSGALRLQREDDQSVKVQLASEGAVPPGLAVAIIGYDPSQPLIIRDSGSEIEARAGVPVPVPLKEPTTEVYRAERLEFDPEPRRLALNPCLFYRGQIFRPDIGTVPVVLEGVQEPFALRIQSRYKHPLKGVRDQFDVHPGQGYLHPNSNLEYKLVFSNVTSSPLNLHVTQALEGNDPGAQPADLQLAPKGEEGESGETYGIINPTDLPEDLKPRNLIVNVSRTNREGKTITSSRRYPFRVVPAKQYITAIQGINTLHGLYEIWVTHEISDPVTVPVGVHVMAEPANLVDALTPSWKAVPLGQTAIFRFAILGPIPDIRATITAEGEVLYPYGTVLTKPAPKEKDKDKDQPDPNQPPPGGGAPGGGGGGGGAFGGSGVP